MKPKTNFINPPELSASEYFSHAVLVPAETPLLFIGGQNAVDKGGNIVGKDNLRLQAEKIVANLKVLLKEGGASFKSIIKWNVYLVIGQDPAPAFDVFAAELNSLEEKPLISFIYVPRLALPEALLEIEAVALSSNR